MSALSPAAEQLIRTHAREAEGRGELHPEVLALIYGEQWFRALVPQHFGGLGWPLSAVVRLEEQLARADGAVGWTVTLCSGAGWFAGFFGPGGLDRVFSHPRLCIAGSGTAAGRAERLAGGSYRISGQWQYASGARHATAFTANCVIWAGGAPVPGDDGQPLVRPFLFLRNEVQVLDDWRAVGLVATGSHGFAVSALEVTAERCFAIDAAAAADAAPLYRYPFLPLAEATLAVNSCGMAIHFLDCFAEVFERRKAHLSAAGAAAAGRLFEQGRQSLDEIRASFYQTLDASWSVVNTPGATPQPDPYALVGQQSRLLAATALHWVDKLYPLAGLGAAHVDSEINRVWRDLHTASQHPLLAFA